jgi:hypothetical protein
MSSDEEEAITEDVAEPLVKPKKGCKYWLTVLIWVLFVLIAEVQAVLYLLQFFFVKSDFYCYPKEFPCKILDTLWTFTMFIAIVVFGLIATILPVLIVILDRETNRKFVTSFLLAVNVFSNLTIFCTVFSWLLGYLIDSKYRFFSPVSATTGFMMSSLITIVVIFITVAVFYLRQKLLK